MASALVFLLLAGYAAGEVAQIKGHGAIVAPGMASVAEAAQHLDTLVPLTASSPQFTNRSDALKLLDLIYEGHSQHAFWRVGSPMQADQQVSYLPVAERRSVAYGEIRPTTFVQLLQHAGAQAGQKYYDLGSGTGKTVFAAWLLGLDATGVELIDPRFKTACTSVLKAKSLGFRKLVDGPGVSFKHGSFLDLDFSDADVLFTDSSLFSKKVMANLTRIASRMKPGSKIISSSGFSGDNFRTEGSVLGPTSRSQGSTWTIQTVKEGAANSPKPASLIRQEASTPTAAPKKRVHAHMQRGPIFGRTTLELPAGIESVGGQQVCALESGETTGIAKAAVQR